MPTWIRLSKISILSWAFSVGHGDRNVHRVSLSVEYLFRHPQKKSRTSKNQWNSWNVSKWVLLTSSYFFYFFSSSYNFITWSCRLKTRTVNFDWLCSSIPSTFFIANAQIKIPTSSWRDKILSSPAWIATEYYIILYMGMEIVKSNLNTKSSV